MKSSWADDVAEEGATFRSSDNITSVPSSPTKSTYVPPHLRNRPATAEPRVSGNSSGDFSGDSDSDPKHLHNPAFRHKNDYGYRIRLYSFLCFGFMILVPGGL